ncbi:MAG: hypothetical protein K8W52_17050 [Deltaproteobacteria bacterium]|nr:hypothetical protein [Deltaproteobacteria bacterium]
MLFAAACAKGAATDVDAKVNVATDAPVGADAPTFPDGPPVFDAPPGTPDGRPDATPIPDAATVLDAAPDAMVVLPDGGPLGTGDTCATANDISAQAATAAGFTFNGDTTGLGNDIQPVGTCTGFQNDGPDAVFIVTANAGQTITASITTTWDGAVEVIQACTFAATCLAGTDGIAGGGTETVTTTVSAAGTYYVIADSWDAGDYGPYTLTVKVQ